MSEKTNMKSLTCKSGQNPGRTKTGRAYGRIRLRILRIAMGRETISAAELGTIPNAKENLLSMSKQGWLKMVQNGRVTGFQKGDPAVYRLTKAVREMFAAKVNRVREAIR